MPPDAEGPADADERLLTSADAARRLGVTAATVKRWADRGVLRCARTVGRHRRFRPADVDRLGETLGASPDPLDAWIDRLLADRDRALHAALLAERSRLGAWWRVADAVGPVLDALGLCWETGRIAIRHEHAASERLGRVLARACEGQPVRPGAPRALLATAEGELHTLGLSLVELCVRERGWGAVWAGSRTPPGELAAAVEGGEAEAVILSASLASGAPALTATLQQVAPACARAAVPLLVGGRGPWPPWPGVRVERRFEALRGWCEEVERAPVRSV
jgi:excisionase family DNA binding protein